jgi:hydrogenase nickel incorporation protein HypA/HybF
MHETGIVLDLLRKVEQAGRDAGATKVARIGIWLGALSQFSPHHFSEHFNDEARGTIAEGAELGIEASADIGDPNAQSVMIRSLELDVPEREV